MRRYIPTQPLDLLLKLTGKGKSEISQQMYKDLGFWTICQASS